MTLHVFFSIVPNLVSKSKVLKLYFKILYLFGNTIEVKFNSTCCIFIIHHCGHIIALETTVAAGWHLVIQKRCTVGDGTAMMCGP